MRFPSLPAFACATVSILMLTSCATTHDAHKPHPRPSGYAESAAPGIEPHIDFRPYTRDAAFDYDFIAFFSKDDVPEFDVTSVTLNGVEQEEYKLRNQTVSNVGRHVHGIEDFSIEFVSNWTPGETYKIVVTGVDYDGNTVHVEQEATAPAERTLVGGVGFGVPSADTPYHYATMSFAKEELKPGVVTSVEVDGVPSRDARYFNTGVQLPSKAAASKVPEGESFTAIIDGSRNFQVTAPCPWTQGSEHTMKVTVQYDDGTTETYERKGTATGAGGYWNADWAGYFSITLSETAGIIRENEPVRIAIAPFADDIGDPYKEIRVVTYDPTRPDAGPDGYCVAPHQIVEVKEWRNKKMLEHVETDAETGEHVHRYDPTTTVELVFYADVLPYENRVYQILYGNPKAEAPVYTTDMRVAQHDGLSQTITTGAFEILTAANSGALEQVTITDGKDPVLLEHRLETNGAVHWNPGVYSPPTPWVHASDWEKPQYAQVSGPLMHYTRRYAPLPHMDNTSANVAYTFYASQPYILYSSLLEVKEDIFVAALRNCEVVFNHAVLNEFIWLDHMGTVHSMMIEGSKEHPIHALDIPPDTPWMAFINREQGVGFANIELDYVNTNRYGDLSSEQQPYIYVQNGPWIYWARGIVYPFAGNNMTRLMPVRKGSTYYEKAAWLPYRFEGNPAEPIVATAKKLHNPLHAHEWMPTNKRAPEKWIMPILTMPFNEGVAGAVSAFKPVEE